MDTDLEQYIVIRSITSCFPCLLKNNDLKLRVRCLFLRPLELQNFPKLLKYLK